MTARPFSSLACLAAVSLAAPALAQCYNLTAESTYRDGCMVCDDCPTADEFPMEGSFHLAFLSLSQFGTTYEVTDLAFTIQPTDRDPPHTTLTGSGIYRIGRDGTHTFVLEISVDGEPARTIVPSSPVPNPGEFPTINMKIADMEFPCMTVLNIQAEPGCLCEMTCDNTVDVFDLLAFLDLWFPMDIAADLDTSGTVDVFDLLMYLDCWFAACR